MYSTVRSFYLNFFNEIRSTTLSAEIWTCIVLDYEIGTFLAVIAVLLYCTLNRTSCTLLHFWIAY